jgi:phospholipase/carboxylesterase
LELGISLDVGAWILELYRMLEYELVPAEEEGSRHLMVMLHGLGDSIEGYRWFPEAMGLPWLNYALVNAPDDYYGGFSWFDIQGDIVGGVKRSRALLFELLDHFSMKGFSAKQTTLGGFSQGCLLSIDVGLRYPHKLAGIVGISGWVCEPQKLMKELSPVAFEQRLLITHGTQDPMLKFAIVREEVNKLKAAGLRVEWHEFVKQHTIAGEAEMSVIREFVRAGRPVA